MKKIPTIFQRDWHGDRSRVTREPHPDCAWVFSGEGRATQKIDGTCCAVISGVFMKRRELAPGANAPPLFVLADIDRETGKRVGWVPVEAADKWHLAAWGAGDFVDGTYELIGPKVQGNPEKVAGHVLISHASPVLVRDAVPRDFDGLASYLAQAEIEGVVFHHPDGRMAKIKGRDFGIKRGSEEPGHE